MLLFNHDAVLTARAGARLGIADFRPCTTIGVAREGVLLAAAIYNNYRPPNIEVTFVTASPRWASKGAIRAMLRYPFMQLGCKRLIAITAEQNTPARAFLLRLGFCEEGLHSDALPTGAAVSYGLLAANAEHWVA